MELEGKIIFIGETKTYGANGFRKREMALETEEEYPQKILIEFMQDKCDILDGCFVNQKVKVSINIRGRDWTNEQGEVKYFNTIQGWRVTTVGGSNNTQQPQPQPHNPAPIEDNTDIHTDENDDLPF